MASNSHSTNRKLSSRTDAATLANKLKAEHYNQNIFRVVSALYKADPKISYQYVSEYLNGKRLFTRLGNKWTRSTVRRLIKKFDCDS